MTQLRGHRPTIATATVAILLIVGGCGRSDTTTQAETVSAKPVVQPVVNPAPKPTAPLAESTSCVSAECHADFTAANFVHLPVGMGDCQVCHGPEVGIHGFPLLRDLTETCTFCHAVAGTASHQHAALESGCTTCHSPHASSAKFLLTADTPERLCQGCHDKQLKRFAHDPFAAGQCTVCHQPHESVNAFLLRGGEGPQHCAMCHQPVLDAMASAAHQHDPAKQQCTTCHSPHTTDYPHLLATSVEQTCVACHEQIASHVTRSPVPHHAVHTAEQCANCHNPHASAQTQLLRDRMDRMCLDCHDRPLPTPDGRTVAAMKPVLQQAKFLHGPIRQGECSTCHSVHGGQRQRLLVAAFPETFYTDFEIGKYELCFTCHDRNLVLSTTVPQLTNFRDGEVNLHYLHVNRAEKGRTCRTCHAIHGSELPFHMAESVRFENSRWEMPIGFEQYPDGGSCSPGCHASRTYSRQSAAEPLEIGGVP